MDYPTYLIHYGIEGQKWGVRRFQNEDGTWTEDGLVRRRKDQKHLFRKQERLGRKFDRYTQKMESDMQKGKKISDRRIEKANKIGAKFRTLDYVSKDPETYFKARKARAESIAKFGINSVGTAVGVGAVINNTKNLREINNFINMTKDWEVRELRKRMEPFEKEEEELIKKYGKRQASTQIQEIYKEKYVPIRIKISDEAEKSLASSRNAASNFTKNLVIAGGFTAVNLAKSVAELSVEQHNINKMLKTHYKDVYEKSYKEIAKDLKKHGFEKNNELSDAKQSRIKALISSGKSQEEVAKILGVSTSTVNKYK